MIESNVTRYAAPKGSAECRPFGKPDPNAINPVDRRFRLTHSSPRPYNCLGRKHLRVYTPWDPHLPAAGVALGTWGNEGIIVPFHNDCGEAPHFGND